MAEGNWSVIRVEKISAEGAQKTERHNERRERKAHAGGACKGSDCKRSNGFAGSGCCLIDFTHSYVLWRFFKSISKPLDRIVVVSKIKVELILSISFKVVPSTVGSVCPN